MFSDVIGFSMKGEYFFKLGVFSFLKLVMSSDVLAYSLYVVGILSSWKGGQKSPHNLIDICSEIGIAHSSSGVKKYEFWEANVYFGLWA